MKLSELILEYSSANPFVGIVSMIDLRINEIGAAGNASNHTSVFISSLKSQLTTLQKLLDSAINWNVPEPKLKADLDKALPEINRHISAALKSLEYGEVKSAHDHLIAARKTAIKRSNLKFGDIE